MKVETYCASDCKNYKCPKMLSYSTLKMFEHKGQEVPHADLSEDCEDYKKEE